MEENIRSVEQDTELMKSIGKVTEDVRCEGSIEIIWNVWHLPKCEHQYLKISFDMDGEMFFEGPRDLLKDVPAKVLTFISRMIKSPLSSRLTL